MERPLGQQLEVPPPRRCVHRAIAHAEGDGDLAGGAGAVAQPDQVGLARQVEARIGHAGLHTRLSDVMTIHVEYRFDAFYSDAVADGAGQLAAEATPVRATHGCARERAAPAGSC